MREARLSQLKEKEQQLKAQIQREQAKINTQERRANNHRLIMIGTAVDEGLDFIIEKEDLDILKKYLAKKRKFLIYKIKKSREKRDENKL